MGTWNVYENKQDPNRVVELTWNVIENKRVVRSPWSVFGATPYVPECWPGPHMVPRMFMKTNEIVDPTRMLEKINDRCLSAGLVPTWGNLECF